MNFSVTTVPNAGQRVRGFIVPCGYCGKVATVPCNTFKNPSAEVEDRFLNKRLECMGWKVGKKPKDYRCAGCYSAIKANAKRKSAEKTMSNVTTIPTAAKPPASMSRDDRRIIFEKLNEIYADEKTGYSGDWTDGKVASDLGVARLWVATVRDEMFGPEGGNANIRQSVDEARALLADCRKLAETFTPLLGRAEKIEKTLIEIEKGLR